MVSRADLARLISACHVFVGSIISPLVSSSCGQKAHSSLRSHLFLWLKSTHAVCWGSCSDRSLYFQSSSSAHHSAHRLPYEAQWSVRVTCFSLLLCLGDTSWTEMKHSKRQMHLVFFVNSVTHLERVTQSRPGVSGYLIVHWSCTVKLVLSSFGDCQQLSNTDSRTMLSLLLQFFPNPALDGLSVWVYFEIQLCCFCRFLLVREGRYMNTAAGMEWIREAGTVTPIFETLLKCCMSKHVTLHNKGLNLQHLDPILICLSISVPLA